MKEDNRKKYNFDLLQICIRRDNAKLNGEYIILNRESEIKYWCNCGKEATKGFRYLVDHGAFCKDCQHIIQLEKRKQTNLTLFGVENVMKIREYRKKAEATNLKKFGYRFAIQNKDILEKLKKTNLKKYGVEYVGQNTEIRNKISNSLKDKKLKEKEAEEIKEGA